MTSSTSSSEPRAGTEAGADKRFRRWLRVFCAAFFGGGGLLYLLLLLIDPYDAARFPNFGIVGVDDHNPRMANVSRGRGRDARFDAAIFGNSTGQLIDPHRLNASTGLSFTQLTIPGTGPREQLAVLHWVTSRHPRAEALVLVIDDSWCSPNPTPALQ